MKWVYLLGIIIMISTIAPLALAAPAANHFRFIFRVYDLGTNASDRSDDFLHFETQVTCDEGDDRTVCRFGDNFTVLSINNHYQLQIESNTSMVPFNYDADSTDDTRFTEEFDAGDCRLTAWSVNESVGIKQFILVNRSVDTDGIISPVDIYFWTNKTCPECNTTVDFTNDTLVLEERSLTCFSPGGARHGSIDFSLTQSASLDSDPESPGTWPLGNANTNEFRPEDRFFWAVNFLVDGDWANETNAHYFVLGGRMGDKDTEVGWSWNITTDPTPGPPVITIPPILATVIKIITQPFIQSTPANIVQIIIKGTHATIILSRPSGNVSIIQNRTAQAYVQAFATPDQIPGGIPFVKAGQGTTFTT